MDILQPLPIEKWSLLRDSLKRDWPVYAYNYTFVCTAMKWRQNNPDLKLEIYCPNGKHDSGTFIGIYSENLYVVHTFTFEESKNLFQKAIENTNVIDWHQDRIYFAAVHDRFLNALLNSIEKIKISKQIEIDGSDGVNSYFKSKEECMKLSVEIPEECELKYLSPSDIPLIHSVWPHRDRERPHLSTKFLESFVILNKGVGLYLKKDNSLVSWILHTEWGGLGMLQTVSEHKRKGYGKIVTKALTKELAEKENLDSVLFVIKGNQPSEKLFQSLNYKIVTSATWVIIKSTRSKNSTDI